jgi:hypothetical protein
VKAAVVARTVERLIHLNCRIWLCRSGGENPPSDARIATCAAIGQINQREARRHAVYTPAESNRYPSSAEPRMVMPISSALESVSSADPAIYPSRAGLARQASPN